MARKEVSEKGTTSYYDDDGKLHREDGPAVEFSNGFKVYYNHGKKVTEEEFKGEKKASWRRVLAWDIRDTEQELHPPPQVKDEMIHFLDKLRESGKTNMFGAGPYLEKYFRISRKNAHIVLDYWMRLRGIRWF